MCQKKPFEIYDFLKDPQRETEKPFSIELSKTTQCLPETHKILKVTEEKLPHKKMSKRFPPKQTFLCNKHVRSSIVNV